MSIAKSRTEELIKLALIEKRLCLKVIKRKSVKTLYNRNTCFHLLTFGKTNFQTCLSLHGELFVEKNTYIS